MTTRNATIIAALAAALLAGCGKDGETAPPAEPSAAAPVETDPVKTRMKDPEYRQRLNAAKDRSKELRNGIIKARRALAEAKGRSAPADEIAALEAEVARSEKEFAENSMRVSAMVAAQMRGDATGKAANENNELHK